MDLDLNLDGQSDGQFDLSGGAAIARQSPLDTNGDGVRDRVREELVGLELVGVTPAADGPTRVRLGAAPSLGAVDQALGSGYGIFNGASQAWAKLRFTPERARWVAGETWHPLQESSVEADGSYLLSFPYADDRELIGDIMRFGADVQVLAPAGLRSKVQKGFLEAAAKYV